MKKRTRQCAVLICCILFTIVGSMVSVLPVSADIIWEPEDMFYNDHASECTYVNRAFTANGPDGIVIVYKNPESPQKVTQLENGTVIYISYTYQDSDGILWGIYENTNAKKTGWMPMEYMEIVYDSISFAEEFQEEIVGAVEQDLDSQYLGQEIYLWEYPGAENGTPMQTQEHLPTYSHVFQDEEGRLWGNVNYYYGMKNKWVCIDQPTADFEALFPNGAPQRGNTKNEQNNTEQEKTSEESTKISSDSSMEQPDKQSSAERIVPKQKQSIVIITTILVLVVVLVTAGLLVILWRRK